MARSTSSTQPCSSCVLAADRAQLVQARAQARRLRRQAQLAGDVAQLQRFGQRLAQQVQAEPSRADTHTRWRPSAGRRPCVALGS